MVTGGAIRRPYEANCTESYSRSATPRATPGLLHRELLPVCNAKKTKTHSRTNHHANCDNFKHHATKQTNPSNWHGPNEPLLCFLPNRTAHCQLLEVSNASAPQATNRSQVLEDHRADPPPRTPRHGTPASVLETTTAQAHPGPLS